MPTVFTPLVIYNTTADPGGVLGILTLSWRRLRHSASVWGAPLSKPSSLCSCRKGGWGGGGTCRSSEPLAHRVRAGGMLCGVLTHHTQPLGSEGPGRQGSETISGEKCPFARFPVHRQLPAPFPQRMAASWFLQCQEVFSAMGCGSSLLSSQGSNDSAPTC